jgi:hypothetical protein
MRSKFPWFWILQFLLLSLVGLGSLLYPPAILYFFRGYFPPGGQVRPESELRSWVLGIEQIDPPSERVRRFFTDHDEVRFAGRGIWTPDDASLRDFVVQPSPSAPKKPETVNSAWEEVEVWFLSSKPPPPVEHREAIEKWIRALDQLPQPSAALSQWVGRQREPAAPPRELRLMILEGTQVLPYSWHLAAQQIRLTAPCILAAAFFTLLGMLAPSIRRPLARVFVIELVFWCLTQFSNSFATNGWDIPAAVNAIGFCVLVFLMARMLRPIPNMTAGTTAFVMLAFWWAAILVGSLTANISTAVYPGARIHMLFAFGAATFGGLVNGWYWLIGENEDPPQDNGGIVQRRPPQLWTLWAAQFAILFCAGLTAVLFPQHLTDLFIREEFEHWSSEVVVDSVKTLGAWVVFIALLTYFALGVGQDWVWQSIGIVFCLVFLLLAVSTLQVAADGKYSGWLYLYGFQGVAFIPLTLVFLRKTDLGANANVERMRAEEWSLTDLVIAPWLLWRPLREGRRPLFAVGVGARGRLEMAGSAGYGTSQDWPPSEFFVPGRHLPVEMRFSNATQDDDASLDIRGCALRIGGGATDRLDLLFATGEFSPYSTLLDFYRYLGHAMRPTTAAKGRLLCEGLAAGRRRAPRSYADLSYYQQFVLEWATTDARCYLVRFRIIPEPAPQLAPQPASQPASHPASQPASEPVAAPQLADPPRHQPGSPDAGSPDAGSPGAEDLNAIGDPRRLPDETRSPDYLRQELTERLAGGVAIHWRLEAQFHEPLPMDTRDWYDASIEWELPWTLLARIVLDAPMSAGDSERQVFDPSRMPLSITVPRPGRFTDLFDPRALASARFRMARVAARVRLWRLRIRQKVPRWLRPRSRHDQANSNCRSTSRTTADAPGR